MTRLSTGLVALLVTLAVGFVSLLEFLSKKDDEEIEEFLPVRTWRRLKRVLVAGLQTRRTRRQNEEVSNSRDPEILT